MLVCIASAIERILKHFFIIRWVERVYVHDFHRDSCNKLRFSTDLLQFKSHEKKKKVFKVFIAKAIQYGNVKFHLDAHLFLIR